MEFEHNGKTYEIYEWDGFEVLGVQDADGIDCSDDTGVYQAASDHLRDELINN